MQIIILNDVLRRLVRMGGRFGQRHLTQGGRALSVVPREEIPASR